MAEKINLRSSKVKEQKRRVADYGTETPLSSTAVERGSTRWLSGSTVVIEGLLDVTGLTTISGTLNVSGTTTLSGSTTIAGPTGITGALTIAGSMGVTGPSTFAGTLGINGDTAITGKLDIKGNTTLTGNMDVLDGGKIKVGASMTLTPATKGGSVQFANGTSLSSSGTAIGLAGGGSTLDVSSAGVQVGTGLGAIMDLMADNTWAIAGGGGSLMATGGGVLGIDFATVNLGSGATTVKTSAADIKVASPLINLNAPQTSVNGNLVVTGTAKVTSNTELLGRVRVGNPYTTGNAPNIYMDANGWLYRTSWVP